MRTASERKSDEIYDTFIKLRDMGAMNIELARLMQSNMREATAAGFEERRRRNAIVRWVLGASVMAPFFLLGLYL